MTDRDGNGAFSDANPAASAADALTDGLADDL